MSQVSTLGVSVCVAIHRKAEVKLKFSGTYGRPGLVSNHNKHPRCPGRETVPTRKLNSAHLTPLGRIRIRNIFFRNFVSPPCDVFVDISPVKLRGCALCTARHGTEKFLRVVIENISAGESLSRV